MNKARVRVTVGFRMRLKVNYYINECVLVIVGISMFET